jgi:hypothetical protein
LLLNILTTFNEENIPKENLKKIIDKILKEKTSDFDLINSILLFTLNSLKIDSKVFDIVYENNSILDWLKDCLFCKDERIRRIISRYLILMIELNDGLRNYSFDYFFKIFPDIEKYSETCESFFNLFEKLIENKKQQQEEEIENIIKKILNRPFEKKEDLILIGYLNLLKSIFQSNEGLKKNRKEFLINIYYFLFEVPNEHSLKKYNILPPKCKSRNSRKSAFDLIVELIRNDNENEEFKELLNLLNELITESKKNSWVYSSSDFTMSTKENNFVGLKNAGSTCYMNSLLQQFFMVPGFRNGMLNTDVPSIEDIKNDDNKVSHHILIS